MERHQGADPRGRRNPRPRGKGGHKRTLEKVLREEMKAQDAGKIITDLIEGDVIKLADQRNHIQKGF